MSGDLTLLEVMGAGAALLDYDRDGDLDAYLVQGRMLGRGKDVSQATFPPRHPEPLSDRLYRNDLRVLADGSRSVRFADVTAASGLGELATGYGMGVATGDYDGDGWTDLYLASYGSNQLLRNQGDGTFADVTAESGTDDPRWSVAATFFDYDGDGALDLFVADYVDFSFARHHECTTPTGAPDYCGPLAYRPVPDRLLRNRGDGTFEDVSAASGILAAPGNGLGVVAADLDGDGLTDLYVANDQMANFLWHNQGDGTFREDALLAGCAVDREGLPEASMGVSAEDLDDDGDEDLFVAHLVRETNTLYLNDGAGLFRDRTTETGLGPPSLRFTSFGIGLLDLENDGDLDLLVTNGAVTRIEEQVAQGDPYPVHQTNQLFRNLGGLRFEDATAAGGPALAQSEVSRGLAAGDVDGDGDLDALLANNSGPARLLLNLAGQDRHWLGVRPVGTSGGEALGARVEVTSAGRGVTRRRVHTDGSYASANDPRVGVGLGDLARAGRLRVVWPDGPGIAWRELAADRYVSVYRPPAEDGR
jgi:hypothetical protein